MGGGGGGAGLLTGTGAGVLVVAGLVGACEDDESSANANGITISTANKARTPSTFLLRLVSGGTSAGKNVFVTAGGSGTSNTLVGGRSGAATCMPALVAL